MDNGLIFPYPSMCAHDEAFDTNHPKPLFEAFGWMMVCGAWDLIS
jgi:hypothetical protein